MTIIEWKNNQATYDSKVGKWISSEKFFQDFLNKSLPKDEDIPIAYGLMKGGIDKIVVDEVKKILGDDVEVIVSKPDPPPEEKKDVLI